MGASVPKKQCPDLCLITTSELVGAQLKKESRHSWLSSRYLPIRHLQPDSSTRRCRPRRPLAWQTCWWSLPSSQSSWTKCDGLPQIQSTAKNSYIEWTRLQKVRNWAVSCSCNGTRSVYLYILIAGTSISYLCAVLVQEVVTWQFGAAGATATTRRQALWRNVEQRVEGDIGNPRGWWGEARRSWKTKQIVANPSPSTFHFFPRIYICSLWTKL